MNSMHEFIVREEMRDSPTMSAANMAAEAAKRGKKVDVVTIGDLFPKPPQDEVEGWVATLKADAKKAGNEADEKFKTLREPGKLYAYSETTGLPSLRAAAAECFTKDTGMKVAAKNIMVGTGGKGALNGALAVFKAGDVVLLAAPGWPTNYDMFPAGVKLVELATKDGLIRADDLKAALAKYPNPAGILINAPSNPTGANYAKGEREEFFAAVAAGTKDTIVLSDDPYGKLVFDRPAAESIGALTRGDNEKKLFEAGRVACFRTVSKEYGLAGLRVGLLISHNEKMLSSLKKWNESKGGGMGVEDQIKAQAALMYGDQFIIRTVEGLLKKRDILKKGIDALSTASMEAPSGTIYGWVDFAGLKGATVPAGLSETGEAYSINTPADAARYLVNVAGVCGVPGVPFFAPDSPAGKDDWHARISFCVEEAQLQRVISNLAAAEQKLEGLKKAA